MGFRFQASVLSLATLILLGSTATPSRADSPITSTDFSRAYTEYDLVAKAKQTGVLDLEMAQYLSSRSTPVDIKAALINALSWDINGKRNAQLYRYYLGLTHNQPIDALKMDQLSGDELFALGYMTVMDDYNNPQKGLPYLQEARLRQPKSYTVAMVHALTEAQIAFDSDWCQIWKVTDKVTNNTGLDHHELRPMAKTIILDYMGLYKKHCR